MIALIINNILKLNSKFRKGDKVKYSAVVEASSGNYEIDCTGVITEIEGDKLYIKRERSVNRIDEKKESEVRKA